MMNIAVHAAMVQVRTQILFWIDLKKKLILHKLGFFTFELNYLKPYLEQLLLFLYYLE